MPVTAETSEQFKDVTDPRTNGGVDATYLRDVQYVPFNFVQGAGVGDSPSTADLVYLQRGRYVILPKMSFIQWSAFGASRVLDIGITAHTNEAGAAVAANLVRFDDDVDISAAGSAAMGSDMVIADAAGISLNIGGVTNTDGAIIRATVTGGAGIPAAAVLRGYVALVRVG
jgi:hypothetical protein